MAYNHGHFARSRSGAARPFPPDAGPLEAARAGITVAPGRVAPPGVISASQLHGVVEIVHTQTIQRIQVVDQQSVANARAPAYKHVSAPVLPGAPGSLFIPPHIAEVARPGTLVVYVLLCHDARFYVGKTSYLSARLEEHARGEGTGSQWTQKYRPQFVLEVRPGDGFQELSTTLEYMQNHGIDRVRGGDYSMLQLTDDHRAQIEKHLRGAADKCYVCGVSGHFAADCTAAPLSAARRVVSTPPRILPSPPRPAAGNVRQRPEAAVCDRCGRSGHAAETCYAKRHVNGSESMPCGRCGRHGHAADACYAKTHASERVPESIVCQRCGRDTHTAEACYAKKHADGSDLSIAGNCLLIDGDESMAGSSLSSY
jgi:hypothetical protein